MRGAREVRPRLGCGRRNPAGSGWGAFWGRGRRGHETSQGPRDRGQGSELEAEAPSPAPTARSRARTAPPPPTQRGTRRDQQSDGQLCDHSADQGVTGKRPSPSTS